VGRVGDVTGRYSAAMRTGLAGRGGVATGRSVDDHDTRASDAPPKKPPHVRLLGSIRFVTATGTVIDLPSASQRRLVAVLGLNAGVTVRAAQLTDLLGIQSGALRATVSRVRRTIGDDVLHTDPVGYRLDATTDLALFADRVTTALSNQHRPTEVEAFDAALLLWRGPPLDEFADEPWAEAAVARAQELRSTALDGRAAALIRADRLGEAVADLTRHVAEQPFRDRSRGLLMLALALQGRQADALRAFEEYRAHLAEQVGTVPSADVRALDRWVADDDGTAPPDGWPAPTDRPNPIAAAPPELPIPAPRARNNVPMFRSPLVGRRRELADLVAASTAGAVLTLVGEGGVGKTRLAATVADELVERDLTVWFVELAAVSDDEAVVGTVASVVGAPLENGRDGLEAFIGERRAVVVLDNCEHVLDAVADLVDSAVGTCHGLTVIVTSREALGVDGERVIRVRPLDPLSDASELFLARAESAGATVRPDERDQVETICRRLDGNPLAIELAAPRVASLGLRSIIDGLDDRFVLLSEGRRRGDDRHRTLAAVVEWSYRLLKPSEQRAFRALGVFSGGFELDAARHVWSALGHDDTEATNLLVSLVDRSMVVAEPGVDGTRFRLLDTLRAYALDQLHRRDETTTAVAAQASWIASITDGPFDEWMTNDSHRRTLRLEREVDNWRDAVAHALATDDPDLAGRLCGAPVGMLLWGRPDLVDLAEGLERVIVDHHPGRSGHVGAAYGQWGREWLRLDVDGLFAACDRFESLAPDDSTGIGATMHAASLVAAGDMWGATAVRATAIRDPRTAPGGRDVSIAIAVYGACSAGMRASIDPEWARRTEHLARRSDVPTIRTLARVASAWMTVDDDPAVSMRWLHEALADPAPRPAYWNRLISTFVSRFLTAASPPDAARQLLRVLPEFDSGLSGADAVALVTAAGLLTATAHPDADDVVASLAAQVSPHYLVTVVPDLEQRRSRGAQLEPDVVITVVRSALDDIAGSNGTRADAPL
jgi:predicted ATPase/DNA-binding SARP family transcriptional activator